MKILPLLALAGLCAAASGCVSLEESRTARIVLCSAAAPQLFIGGERVDGVDAFGMIQERRPDRVVIMAEGGPLAAMASAMASAMRRSDVAPREGVQFADTQADRARAARMCAAG
jgi:hypothetical protein